MWSEFFFVGAVFLRRCRWAGLVILWEKTLILWEMQTQMKHVDFCWNWLDSLLCQVVHVCFVSSQFLKSSNCFWGTAGTVAAFACGSSGFQSCISAADPPCCKCRIPRLAECGAAGALGVKQSYWAMAALSDCLEMHNSSYMVFFLLSFTFLYISICFVPTYWIK